MNDQPKKFPFIAILAIVFSPNLVGFSPAPVSPAENAYHQEISVKFPQGKNRGGPVTTSGGGTRSGAASCLTTKAGELSLNALTPNYQNVVTTASVNPTLYFYIPSTQATLGELVLTDEDEVYQTLFTLPGQPGIAKLTLQPQTTLVSGKQYKWSLMIICDRQDREQDISIQGKLKYQKLDKAIAQSLEAEDPLKKAEFYANQGYWLDTLENAAKSRSKQPQEWTELLKSVGLGTMSNLPFVECCKPKNKP
jgi:hypothetical protein